jgi:hypothetical protein
MPSRRDFIKALGGALGAGVLTAAGGSAMMPKPAGAAEPPLPNAYEYIKLISTNEGLPGGQTLAFLPGPVMINDTGKVLFYAKDATETMGIYEKDISSGALRKVVRSGDTLPDGTTVGHVYGMDTNGNGSVAVLAYAIEPGGDPNKGLHGAYLEKGGNGLQPAATFNQQVPGTSHRFGSHFTDMDLHSNDDLALVTYYTTEGEGAAQTGLIHMPSSGNGNGRVVVSSPALVHGQEGQLSSLGLVHVNRTGDYILQAHTPSGGALATADPGMGLGAPVRQDSMLVRGNVYSSEPNGFVSLAWPDFPKPGGPPPSGEIIYGPRISDSNDPAYVVHITDERQSLVLKNRTIISSGDLAPAGWPVISISPPNSSPDGLYFFTLTGYTPENNYNVFQLIAHNGSEARVMLSMLDTLGDKRMINLLWGLHTDQCDSAGRLAFVAEWDDESTQSLMLAIPA